MERDGWTDFPFCSILWSNPLGSLFLCSDLGRLLKIMHETKSSRSRCLLNNRCCDQNVYFYLSAVSAITCLSFYFVELRVVDTSFSEHKSAYAFFPLFLAWEELAYYEENTRDFLFPVPRLTPSYPGLCREVLMKTVEGFPGIAPKIEFSTRTAIREPVFLHRNRFLEERCKSRRPLSTSNGPKFHLSSIKMKPRESNLDRLPQGMQSRPPSPYFTRRFFQDQPAQLNLGDSFKIPGESKPPFVVRHVDSAKPFGENSSEHHSQKSRRKSDFSNFPFPVRRASSLDSLAANIKVIKEPDERIVLRNESPLSLDSSKFGKPSASYSHQGDADFHWGTSFATSQHCRTPSPLLDQPLLRERFHPGSQYMWKKIHERVCSRLTSHRSQQHLNKEDSISEVKNILERPNYPLKKYPVHKQRYF
ncbi:spermatogenesis associated 6-like protein isoform X1 [Delphinapterus leucas]|uniref:Spermatogenesis associated 6-like protein isoform X1 n=2 Tax=Delphinapterus leucas TaxID=9749 RepID=A0A2Y9NJ66_DELLE|nr:spermatogenesis associated 6-like protein isoform X1 [Delphinapterus leucas]